MAQLDRAAKEWIGLFAYRLLGQTAQEIPASTKR